jgi:hypothetical protein
MTTEVSQVIIPSNPVDQKIILDALKEADDSMYRIESERDQIKAIIDTMYEKFPDIPKKYFRRMMKVYHKQNYQVVEGEHEDFTTLYSAIVGE